MTINIGLHTSLIRHKAAHNTQTVQMYKIYITKNFKITTHLTKRKVKNTQKHPRPTSI